MTLVDSLRQYLFVGGTVGQAPTILTPSLEKALRQTALMHVVGFDLGAACDIVWKCAFVDGEPGQLRFTADAPDGAKLYVEYMDIE